MTKMNVVQWIKRFIQEYVAGKRPLKVVAIKAVPGALLDRFLNRLPHIALSVIAAQSPNPEFATMKELGQKLLESWVFLELLEVEVIVFWSR